MNKTTNNIEPAKSTQQEDEVLVRVNGVSKKFARNLKSSLRYGVQDIAREVLGKPRKTNLRKSEFWAVKDVSFELKRGECLGLIGHNGAGKSTLLKILNGLIKPDEGRIEMHGRVAALIELGAGFNPLLSGRENIYNNASVLGFSKAEVDAKLQDIIDFAEIAEAIDAPVQSYSSGMKVRLGFAVAAQMEPDILIVDEVLAVGDMSFKLKCLNTIDSMLKKSAVIFVSHSLPMVSRVCTKGILLENGKQLLESNNLNQILTPYISKQNINGSKQTVFQSSDAYVLSRFTIDKKEVNRLQDIHFDFDFTTDLTCDSPIVSLVIFDDEQRPIASVSSEFSGRALSFR